MEEVWKTGVVMGGERRQDEFKDLVKTLEVLNLQNQDNDAEIEFLVSGYDREQDIQELKENEFKGYVTFTKFFEISLSIVIMYMYLNLFSTHPSNLSQNSVCLIHIISTYRFL